MGAAFEDADVLGQAEPARQGRRHPPFHRKLVRQEGPARVGGGLTAGVGGLMGEGAPDRVLVLRQARAQGGNGLHGRRPAVAEGIVGRPDLNPAGFRPGSGGAQQDDGGGGQDRPSEHGRPQTMSPAAASASR